MTSRRTSAGPGSLAIAFAAGMIQGLSGFGSALIAFSSVKDDLDRVGPLSALCDFTADWVERQQDLLW